MATRNEMIKAAEKAAIAVEHLDPAMRLLALSHAVGLTMVGCFAAGDRTDILQNWYDGPVKRAVDFYGNAVAKHEAGLQ